MTVTVAGPSWWVRGDRWPGRVVRFTLNHPEALTALLCAVVLLIGQRGPDLPAQAYRVFLFRHHGLVAFDSHWYAGHPLPGYSLLFPPIASVIGARITGALACVVSTALFTRLLRGSHRSGHDLAVVWFAVVVVVDLIVGRLPFGLGLAFGLAAVVAAHDRRWVWATLLAAATACASPLAGAFLLIAAAAMLPDLGWRHTLPFAGVFVGIGAAVVFGEGGWFPFPWTTLLIILITTIAGLVVVPRSSGVVRRGLLLYGLSSVALFPWHNQIGGNMARFGAVFVGPVVAYELWRANRKVLLALVSVPIAVWQFAPLPTSFATGQDNPSAFRSYYSGLLRYLDAHNAQSSRVEVPLTNGRWEADYLAAKVPLARGWERQVDLAYNSVLYNAHLSSEQYHQWLLTNGIAWVALPDVVLDASEKGEQALLTGPTLPYLKPVWHDAHWKLWHVRDARPLVSGPATLVKLGISSMTLSSRGAGPAVVLVRWTRFWRVTTGYACVRPTPQQWTEVDLTGPGTVVITADHNLGSLAGGGEDGSCRSP